jgi:cell division protein FtsA
MSQASDRKLLCVDLGSASIKAALFEEREDQLELLSVSSIPQERGNVIGGSIVHLARTLEHLQEAIRKVENAARKPAHSVIWGVTGEFVKSMNMTMVHERSHPDHPMTVQEMKTILYEMQWEAYGHMRRQIAFELSREMVDIQLINAAVLQFEIDGRSQRDWKGSTGKKVKIELMNAFAQIEHFGQIQSLLAEIPYHELKGTFVNSFAISHALTLQNALESALVIDVGEGTTDVCLLSQGQILGNRSFAMGGQTFTKRLTRQFATSFEEAEAIKVSYSDSQLEDRSHRLVQEALVQDLDIWISSLHLALKELPLKQFPEKILLCGLSSQLPDLQEKLKAEPWKKHYPVQSAVTVRNLEYSDLFAGEFEDQQFDWQYLPLAAVAQTAFDLLYSYPDLDEMLESMIADKGI